MKDVPGSGGKMEIYWGQSSESYDAAIQAAVDAARRDLSDKTLGWFEVVEFRGGFENERVLFQTAVRIGYS